jgi:hypothetical protein
MDLPPVGGASPQPLNSADYGITAEQVAELQQLFADTQVSYVDDAGQSRTSTVANMLDAPTLDADQAIALLQAISAKLRGENIESATEAVQANKEKQELLQQERMEMLVEALQAAADAKSSGTIGEVFAWIGVGLAIIAAVAATALTYGAAAPASALVIAGCIAAITGAALAATSQVVQSIPGAMEGMGQEGQQAFMWTMMALQVTAAIVSLGAGAGSAANAAKATADAAEKATKLMKMASYVSKTTQIASGTSEVSGGAANIAAAEQQHSADTTRAEMEEVAKFIKMLQQGDEKEIEFIRTLQEMTDKAWQIVSGAAKDMMDARQAVVQFSPA